MTASEKNPYLQSRHEWDERYGSIVTNAKNWRLGALVNTVFSAICLLLIVFLVTRSRVVPYVIGVDELGRTVFAGFANETRANNGRLIKASLYDWIEKWRTVTSDWDAQASMIKNVVFTRIADGSPARAAIEAWYRGNLPQDRVKSGVVTVEVKSVLQVSEHLFEADWIERTWSNGAMKSEDHWKGAFSIAISTPTDEKQAYVNPLGLYVTEASWTKVL